MDSGSKNIFDELSKNRDDIDESLGRPCIEFHEKLRSNIAGNLRKFCTESKKEYGNQESKVMRNTKKYVFFGETSSGKSTVINAILKRTDLPCDKGRTTNCFIEIKKTSKKNSYIKFEKKELQIESLSSKINYCSNVHLPHGSRVEVFYSNDDCPMLGDNTVIIDTPGIDTDEKIDEYVLKYCTDADLIVLVVNSVTTINRTMREFIKRSSTVFSNLKFFLIYNHWDEYDGSPNIEQLKCSLIENVSESFYMNLNNGKNFLSQRIFFISAKEEVDFNEDNKLETNPRWIERHNEFHRLIKDLKEELSEDAITRRWNYLNGLYDVQKQLLKECKSAIESTKNEIPKISQRFLSTCKETMGLDAEINKILKETTEPIYDNFIKQSLFEVNKSITMYEIKTYDTNDEDVIKKHRINNLIEKLLNRCFQGIKSEIIEFVNKHEKPDLPFIIKELYIGIYLELYFPKIDASKLSNMNKMGNRMNGAICTASGITSAVVLRIGMNFVAKEIIKTGLKLGVATVASGGIIGGVLIAAGFLHSAATLYNKGVFRGFYEFIWKSEEADVKKSWDEYIGMIQGSYSNFLQNFENKLSNLFNYEEKTSKINEIEGKMNEIRTKMNDFDKEFVPKGCFIKKRLFIIN